MRKICFVDRYAKYSTDLFQYIKKILDSRNFEFLFLGPNNSGTVFSKELKGQILEIWNNQNYISDIYNTIKKQSPDIVHFSFELKTFGTLFNAIKFPFLLRKIRNRTRIVLTLHNILALRKKNSWDIPSYNPIKLPKSIGRILLKTYMKFLCGNCDKVIVGTNLGKKALVEFYGISQDKLDVITLGVPKKEPVDSNVIESLKKRFSNKRIILCFGVISPRKGQQRAIESFARICDKLDDYALVIVGKAPKEFKEYERQLHRLVAEKNLKGRVFLTGFLPESEVHALFEISEMALFIYESMTSSTHALTYAMQYETPAIVSDIEIFHEVLTKKAASFVDPKDSKSLDYAIQELAEKQDLRNEMKNEMRDAAIKNDMKNSAKNYCNIYQELINQD